MGHRQDFMTSTTTLDFTSMIGYSFGQFSLFPDRFILNGNGSAHQLTPRLLAVLQYLIKHHNRVVTKDELIAEVWQGSFIEEGNVSRTISSLRALLGDDAEKPKYIQTVSRVGYRFIHPVDSLGRNEASLQHLPRHAPVPNDTPAFVGRQKELRLLEEMLVKCGHGKSSIVCISGPSGIGKTALVERFVSGVKGRAIIARSACAPSVSTGEPYTPVIDVFADLFNSCADPETHCRLAELAPTWSSHALRAFGTRMPPSVPMLGSANSMNRQFGDAVKELSRKSSLILFIDDFHWADSETVDLVGYLSLLLGQVRLMLIIAVRTTELIRSGHPFRHMSQELQVKGTCHQIPLRLLSFEEVGRYLDATAPVASEKERLAEHVYSHSEGNPLFMVSVLGFLKATQALRETGGKWRIHADLNEISATIPPELDSFLRRSVEQLDPDDRFLIRIASLQGLEFDSGILSEVSAMSPIDVEERLDEVASAHELIRYLGALPLNDGTYAQRYRFVHLLLRRAFQDSVVPSRKKSLGLKIATAISRRTIIEKLTS
jgi:predicted ATPase/DNA-binding winged helix-turn-helix (wHTH) protein